jgi:Tfp pilus assembly PilM family ATPase
MLPAKRLLAIDPGTHAIKLLLVEEMLGRVRVLRHEVIELHEGGLVSEEELLRHLREVVQEVGAEPLALALPHYRALSQVTDLPASEPEEIRKLVEAETVKLSGLGESNIVFDYVALQEFGRYRNPFWLTLCQEGEIQKQITRCGLANADLCEVTTTVNSLVAAWQALEPGDRHVVLADWGAAGTGVAIVLGRQAVYTTTFPLGGDLLTEAIAAQRSCSFEAAEGIKRGCDVASMPEDLGALDTALANWRQELQRILAEWVGEHPELRVSVDSFAVVLCGGAALQAGLVERLNRSPGVRFEAWPAAGEGDEPGGRFAAAYGTALQALGKSRQPASLLPAEVRESWRKQHSLHLLHSLNFFALALVALLLIFGTWQQVEELLLKRSLLANSRAALEKARTTESLSREVAAEYQRLQPILHRQKQTVDALQTLALLQQARSNQDLWYVLFADQRSYFTAPAPVTTNVPAVTNASSALTNLPAFKEGFVAEICLPEDGEPMRRTLSRVVTTLKLAPLFKNVDLLSADRRRNLADTNVVLADHLFALDIELKENPFPRPEPSGERKPGANPRPSAGPADRALPAPASRSDQSD